MRRGPRSPRSRREMSRRAALAAYDRMVDESYIARDLRRTRNMRLAFKDGLLRRRSQGRTDDPHRRPLSRRQDRHAGGCLGAARQSRPREPFTPDNVLTFGKLDAVFKSGNATRDTIPSHLLVGQGHCARGRRLLRPRLSGWGLRAGGRRAPGEPAQLRGLQGDRRARPAVDPARRRQRAQVPSNVSDDAKASLQFVAAPHPQTKPQLSRISPIKAKCRCITARHRRISMTCENQVSFRE